MSDLVSAADYLELTRLVQEVAWRLDNHQAATLGDLVTDDFRLIAETAEDTVSGRAAFVEYGRGYDETDQASGFKHTVSNSRFVNTGENGAAGTTLLAGYGQKSGQLTSTAPSLIGEYRDTYRRTDDGWKLATRRFVTLAFAA